MCPRCQGHYCSGQHRSNDGPDSDVITSIAPFIESCLSLISSRNFPRPVLRNRKCHSRGFPAYQITRCHVPDENNVSSCPCPRLERCHAIPDAVSRRHVTADCGTVSVELVVDKVAMGQHLLPVLLLTSVSIIQPLLKTHLCICQRRCTVLAIQSVVTLSTLRLTRANYWHVRTLSAFSSSPTPTADT